MNAAFQAMYNLLQSDRRYKFEAYTFVREALNEAQRELLGSNELQLSESDEDADEPGEVSRHITGQQLCHACRKYAMEQFGFLAPRVLANWGVHSTGDFGEIVYNLIRIDQMRKSDSDRREDFDDVFDFANAFQPEFKLPTDETD